MIYLYAIAETVPLGFHGRGVDGEPVLAFACEGMHLVHSFHADGFEASAEPDELWAHEGIVEELLDVGPVIPFRFGTTLPDRSAAETYLARGGKRFRRVLGELRGQVELAVGVSTGPRDPSVARDGASYLAARSRERDAQERLLRPLESLAVVSTKRASSERIRASYLVARDDVERFSAAVTEIQASHPEVALTCTGPWAPYSFVGELG